MPTEEAQITIRRPKRGELRTEAIIIFPISGSREVIKERNEPLCWKAINRLLKKKGFMGFYPSGVDERELMLQMRGSPTGPNAAAIYANKTEGALLLEKQKKSKIPTFDELMADSHKALQVLASELQVSKTGSKRQLAKRIEGHIRRENYEELAREKVISDAEAKAVSVEPIPDEITLKTLGRKELQGHCVDHGMSEAGDKETLIARLLGEIPATEPEPVVEPPIYVDPIDQMGHKELQRLCKERNLDWVGEKNVLRARLKNRSAKAKAGLLKVPPKDELMNLGRKDLQKMCSERAIDIEGDREALINKLMAAGPTREVVEESGGDESPATESGSSEEVRPDRGGEVDPNVIHTNIISDPMGKAVGGTGLSCGNCGQAVVVGAIDCPDCKAVFDSKPEEAEVYTPPEPVKPQPAGQQADDDGSPDAPEDLEMFECESCKGPVAHNAKKCPSCGAIFEDGDADSKYAEFDDDLGEDEDDAETTEETTETEGSQEEATRSTIEVTLKGLNFKQLRESCKDHGLKAGGGKAELRTRLLDHLVEEAKEE